MMRAWQLEDFGMANLRRVDRPTPTPGSGELLVRVAAAALNYRDKVVVAGKLLPERMPRPLVPVSDASGRVAAVGPGVTRFGIGDRVATHVFSRWLDGEAGPNEMDHCFGGPLDGGLAEFMIVPEDAAVAVPPSLTDAEAATLTTAALTAWFALVERGGLRAGETVLTQGTGGVSLFAVQFAAAIGARVIATSSSDAKLERARALGATDLINYRATPDWDRVALDLTEGQGVDHVIELAGGPSLNRSITATRVGGQVAVIGFLDRPTAEVNLVPLLFRQTRIQGIAVGHRRAFERMNRFIEEHRIRPVIDSTYPFEDAPAAFDHLDRGPFGKVVINVGG